MTKTPDYLGISKNTVTQWKIGRTSSYMNYIDRFVAFFVSADYLSQDQTYSSVTFMNPLILLIFIVRNAL